MLNKSNVIHVMISFAAITCVITLRILMKQLLLLHKQGWPEGPPFNQGPPFNYRGPKGALIINSAPLGALIISMNNNIQIKGENDA